MSNKKRVKAIAVGYHGILREPGTASEIFEIDADEDLGTWMVEVDKNGKVKDGQENMDESTKPAAAKATSKKAAEQSGPEGDGETGEAARNGPPANFASPPAPAKSYKAKHNGGGNYIVVDENDQQVGETFKKDEKDSGKAKADSKAKADELNAAIKPADGSANFDQNQLPDA